VPVILLPSVTELAEQVIVGSVETVAVYLTAYLVVTFAETLVFGTEHVVPLQEGARLNVVTEHSVPPVV
jgi:hypothetical protein